jgi:thiamine-phosphate diphosphorylase
MAIADLEVIGPDRLVELALAAIAGGATAIQLRGKKSAAGELLAIADALRASQTEGVPLIVNDRADVAALARAHGVHLGDDDLPISAARRILGPGFWIGRTARDATGAEAAARDGADYLGVGSVFAGGSKAGVPVIGLPGLAAVASASAAWPVVAIGGITAETAGACIAAGAAGVAVIGALFAGRPAPDQVTQRARAIRAAVDGARAGGGNR